MPLDQAEAARWYLMAAERGDAAAMYLIGNRYRIGLGVKTDPTAAKLWQDKALAAGFEPPAGE